MRSYFAITKNLLYLAIPTIMTSVASGLITVLGMLMAASLGPQELAAGALATSSYLALANFFTACLFSVGILVSYAKGQNLPKDISSTTYHGFLLGICLSIPATVLMEYYPGILLFFHQDPILVKNTVSYFHGAAWGMLPSILVTGLQQFFIGMRHPKMNLYCSLVRVPITLILADGLILGKWGLPFMGLGGIMVAQTIVLWALLFFLMAYLHWHPTYRDLKIFSRQQVFSWPLCQKLFSIGIPIGLQFGIELSAIALSTYFMGWLGKTALAAQQIASQCTFLMVMVMMGIAQPLSLLISHADAQGDLELVQQTGTVGFSLGMFIMSGISFIFFFFPDPLINLFIPINDPGNQSVVHLARIFLSLAGVLLIIDTLRNTAASALRGLQDSRTPMWIGGFSLWCVSLPVSYAFAFLFHWGPIGLRIGFLSGFLLCAFWLLRRFYDAVKSYSPQDRIQTVQ